MYRCEAATVSGMVWPEDDLEKIKAPKPKKERRQNKVVCRAERMRYTQKKKLDLIQQFDEAKAEDPSLTIKSWCHGKNLNDIKDAYELSQTVCEEGNRD